MDAPGYDPGRPDHGRNHGPPHPLTGPGLESRVRGVVTRCSPQRYEGKEPPQAPGPPGVKGENTRAQGKERERQGWGPGWLMIGSYSPFAARRAFLAASM